MCNISDMRIKEVVRGRFNTLLIHDDRKDGYSYASKHCQREKTLTGHEPPGFRAECGSGPPRLTWRIICLMSGEFENLRI